MNLQHCKCRNDWFYVGEYITKKNETVTSIEVLVCSNCGKMYKRDKNLIIPYITVNLELVPLK